MPDARLSPSVRRTVADRASGCCEYCLSQERFSPDSFSVDHIIPRSAGGGNELENLALACQGCNSRKYNRTSGRDPIGGEEVMLFSPRTMKRQDHFTWDRNFSHIIGLTPTGRATVIMLELNRESLVRLRRILFKAGEHPPLTVP